jgi:putative transposase
MARVRTSLTIRNRMASWSGHKSLKSECIQPGTPLTREEALRPIRTYVDHYNTVRLHSAIGYVTPHDMLAGRQAEIYVARDRKPVRGRTHRREPIK